MKKVKVILAFILLAQNFVNEDKARQPRNRSEKRAMAKYAKA